MYIITCVLLILYRSLLDNNSILITLFSLDFLLPKAYTPYIILSGSTQNATKCYKGFKIIPDQKGHLSSLKCHSLYLFFFGIYCLFSITLTFIQVIHMLEIIEYWTWKGHKIPPHPNLLILHRGQEKLKGKMDCQESHRALKTTQISRL